MTTAEMEEILKNFLQEIKEEIEFKSVVMFVLGALIIVGFLAFMIYIKVREDGKGTKKD